MWTSLKKINCVLKRRDYSRLATLMIPVVLVSLMELLSICSILPFMQIVADPQALETNERLIWLNSFFEFSSRRSMLLWIGTAILVIQALTAISSVVSQWLIQKVVWGIGHKISMNLLTRYMRLSYEYFLTHNSADMVKKAVADINSLVTGVIMVSCKFIADAFKSAVILILLFFVDASLALLAFVVFGGVYIFIHVIRHRYLENLGRVRQETIRLRIKSFTEALSGIKTIRVSGATDWFVGRFEKASKTFCTIQPKFQLYNLFPTKLVEFLAVGGILLVILFQLLAGNDLANIIPVLSVFALATFKLMPALSSAFSQAATLSHNLPIIDEVDEDMKNFKALFRPIKEFATADPIVLNHELVLENVSYQYKSAGTPVLRDVNLKIQKYEKCALVGTTGCGKSTLIDIMVGLLQPQSGRLLVDSREITPENVYGWQTRIAYVPQDVFLCDDTIAANIALGIPPEQIDQERLVKSARLAQVDEFIDSEFRQGFDTFVGEHGVRLSGGQRQRIGLARAFYRQPDVLFLDEATSALDSVTEEAIVSAIEKEMPNLTLMLISHRLTSTRFCDRIFFVDKGQIIDSGSYENLMKTSDKFRQMVDINE